MLSFLFQSISQVEFEEILLWETADEYLYLDEVTLALLSYQK